MTTLALVLECVLALEQIPKKTPLENSTLAYHGVLL
jgi:hypothetical protein